jgi:type IV secretion system protein VirD4
MAPLQAWWAARLTRWLLAVAALADLLAVPSAAAWLTWAPAALAAHRPAPWPAPWVGWAAVATEPAIRSLFAALALAVLAGAAWLSWRATAGSPGSDPQAAYGSARWRDPRTLPATLARWRWGAPNPPAGFVVGADPGRPVRAAWVVGRDDHVLLLGAPGAGKSTLAILPTLGVLAQSGQSVLVTDPKGELWQATAGLFHAAGYTVVRFDLREPALSTHRWNPCDWVAAAQRAGDVAQAGQRARQLAQLLAQQGAPGGEHQAFFATSTTAIVTALLLAVLERAPADARHLPSCYHTLIHTRDLDGFVATFPPAHPVQQAYGVVRLSPPETRQNQLTVAATALQLFADPAVAWLVSGSDYAVERFARGRQAVFVVVPDDSSVYYPLAALLLSQILQAVSLEAARSPGQRLAEPVHLILDEFGNLPAIPDFDKALSVARGKGVRIAIALQTLSQLDARYGEAVAEAIRNACNTVVYLSSNDPKTAQWVSAKTGQATVATTSRSRGPRAGGPQETVAATGRPLLTPDEVLRWPWGQALLLQAGQLPARLPLRRFADWPFPAVPPPAAPAQAVADPPRWHPAAADPAPAPDFAIGRADVRPI